MGASDQFEASATALWRLGAVHEQVFNSSRCSRAPSRGARSHGEIRPTASLGPGPSGAGSAARPRRSARDVPRPRGRRVARWERRLSDLIGGRTRGDRSLVLRSRSRLDLVGPLPLHSLSIPEDGCIRNGSAAASGGQAVERRPLRPDGAAPDAVKARPASERAAADARSPSESACWRFANPRCIRSAIGTIVALGSSRAFCSTRAALVSSRAALAHVSSCSADSMQPRTAGTARAASGAPAARRMADAAATRSQPWSKSSLSAARRAGLVARDPCMLSSVARASTRRNAVAPPSCPGRARVHGSSRHRRRGWVLERADMQLRPHGPRRTSPRR